MPDSRQQVQMNKTNSGPKCLPCERRFVTERDLENHMNAKHQPKKCPLCNETFKSKLDLVSHINNCVDTPRYTGQQNNCNHCNKSFSRVELNRHIQNDSCRSGTRNITCKQCNAICISQDDLRKHIADDHENTRSREVCRHWKAGNCFRGDRCMFAHVGYQDKSGASNSVSSTPCRNGRNCSWLERGHCKFGHRGSGEGARQSQSRQSSSQRRSEKMCWDNENCRKNFCSYKHVTRTDFPNIGMNQNKGHQCGETQISKEM